MFILSSAASRLKELRSRVTWRKNKRAQMSNEETEEGETKTVHKQTSNHKSVEQEIRVEPETDEEHTNSYGLQIIIQTMKFIVMYSEGFICITYLFMDTAKLPSYAECQGPMEEKEHVESGYSNALETVKNTVCDEIEQVLEITTGQTQSNNGDDVIDDVFSANHDKTDIVTEIGQSGDDDTLVWFSQKAASNKYQFSTRHKDSKLNSHKFENRETKTKTSKTSLGKRTENSPIVSTSYKKKAKMLRHSTRRVRLLSVPKVEIAVFRVFDPVNTVLSQSTTPDLPGPEIAMRYELLRVYTLRSYKNHVKRHILRLAGAGFYYAGNADEVTCYVCGIKHHALVETEAPIDIHKRIAPDCRFLTENEEVNVPLSRSDVYELNRFEYFEELEYPTRITTKEGTAQLLSIGQCGYPVQETERFQLPREHILDQLQEYKMNRKPRGLCCIINNKSFDADNNDRIGPLTCREGTDKDAERLHHVFKRLSFCVKRRDNLKDTDMMMWMKEISYDQAHTEYDVFACFILSHGVLGHVYGSNGKLVSIKDLTSLFRANRCPLLAGKPKLFFIQACRESAKMTGGDTNSDADDYINLNNSCTESEDESDFLLAFSTTIDKFSYRDLQYGSIYVQTLCDILEKYSSRDDLLSILVEVIKEVSNAKITFPENNKEFVYKQTPELVVRLEKKLYFR